MKQLNLTETNLVSGGDFNLNWTMHVPSDCAPAITGLVQQIVSGQVFDTAAFASALNAAGPMLNEVKISVISFSDFN
ncbi:MAG: hypothetical protein AB7I18_04855 [Candidatus Berkiella sp.]